MGVSPTTFAEIKFESKLPQANAQTGTSLTRVLSMPASYLFSDPNSTRGRKRVELRIVVRIRALRDVVIPDDRESDLRSKQDPGLTDRLGIVGRNTEHSLELRSRNCPAPCGTSLIPSFSPLARLASR